MWKLNESSVYVENGSLEHAYLILNLSGETCLSVEFAF